jgi:cysteine desulfurase
MEIYLDNNATTPIDAKVLAAMHEIFTLQPSNPSSFHAFGRKAREILTKSRKSVADYLGIRPSEFIFTSSGTESLNTLIRGIPAKKIITTHVEHPAIDRTIAALGMQTTRLSVDQTGSINLVDLERADGDLIILSAVNSETGALLDLNAVAAIADARRIPLIIDGVALLGKERFTIPRGVSAMAFSAHKLHGPTGVGGHFLRSSLKCTSLLTGGVQEQLSRAGTENLAGIVGFAKAISLIEDPNEIRALRDYFESLLPGHCNGTGPRVSNTSNLYFPGMSGESLLIQLDLQGIMASQGSACTAGALLPSRILLGMGYSKERAMNSIRFSFSRMNKVEELNTAGAIIQLAISNKFQSASL